MRSLRRELALLLIVLSCWTCLHAEVARADAESKEYRTLVSAGLEEYDLGHFQEALSLFEKAHRLQPNARTLRGMGMAAYQARKYVIATGYLRAALTDARKPLTPQFRREVSDALDSCEGFVSTFVLDVVPTNATLIIDGEPFTLGADGKLALDPGEHEIVASAPDYKTESRRLTATAGRSGQASLHLEPLISSAPVVASAPVATTPAPTAPRVDAAPSAVSPGIKALTITGLSVALVGGSLGLGAGLKAMHDEDQLHASCPDKQCPSDQASKLDQARTWANLSTAALAVGGAGLVAGLVGVALWVRGHKRGAAVAMHTPQVWLRASGTSLSLSGRF